MLLTALILASQTFGSTYPEFFRKGQEDAFIQDQLPVVCGMKQQGVVLIGLYTLLLAQAHDPLGTPINKEVTNYVGDTQSKITKDKFAGEDCLVLKASGMRPKVTSVEAGIMKMTQNMLYRKQRICWVSEKGKLMHEIDVYDTDKGTFTANASFRKDDIEIIWTDPKGKYETTVLNPVDGVEPFDREFSPMIVGKEVVMREKEFCRLDPIAKAFRKYKAKVLGPFSAKLMGGEYHGHMVEVTCDKRVEKVYVSDEGDLLQVNLPNGHYMYRNQIPDSKIDKLARIQARMQPLGSLF